MDHWLSDSEDEDSDSEDENDFEFRTLEEYKKHRAEHEHSAPTSERVAQNTFTEMNYMDLMNSINQKVRKSMQNSTHAGFP